MTHNKIIDYIHIELDSLSRGYYAETTDSPQVARRQTLLEILAKLETVEQPTNNIDPDPCKIERIIENHYQSILNQDFGN